MRSARRRSLGISGECRAQCRVSGYRLRPGQQKTPAEQGLPSGRYRTRTCDLCRVKGLHPIFPVSAKGSPRAPKAHVSPGQGLHRAWSTTTHDDPSNEARGRISRAFASHFRPLRSGSTTGRRGCRWATCNGFQPAPTTPGGVALTGGCGRRPSGTNEMPSGSSSSAKSEVIRGLYVDERAGKVLFSEWAEHCMALNQVKLSRSSYARDTNYLKNHVLPRWGGVRLNRVAKGDVERWVADLAEPGHTKRARGGTLAPATIERIYQVFRKIMTAAYDDDRIAELPCPEHPPIGRKKRKPVRFLDEAQVDAPRRLHRPRLRGDDLRRRLRRVPDRRAHGPAPRRHRLEPGHHPLSTKASPTSLASSPSRTPRPSAASVQSRWRTSPSSSSEHHIDRAVGWNDPGALLLHQPAGAP